MKQEHSRISAGEQKSGGAQTAKEGAVAEGLSHGAADRCTVAVFVCFGDHGKQKDTGGIDQCRGKHDQGQCHTGEDTIDGKGLRLGKAVPDKAAGNGDGFHALEDIDGNPAGGKRQGQCEDLSGHGQGGTLPRSPGDGQGTETEKAQIDCRQGNKHGKAFPDGKTDDRTGDLRCALVRPEPSADKKDTSHPGELFQYLCQCRDTGTFDAVEISVDQRMGGTEGNGQCENAQQRRGTFFQ